jgi:membrane protease YdiL (CAAX protease family)
MHTTPIMATALQIDTMSGPTTRCSRPANRVSHGLRLPREKAAAYSLYALIGLVAPGLIVGFDRGLLMELIEQVAYIGLAEELFFRGYITSRLLAWLGNARGLLVSAFLFALVHLISRVSEGGLQVSSPSRRGLSPDPGWRAALGLHLHSSEEHPSGAILHISGNMYIGRIIELLSAYRLFAALVSGTCPQSIGE